MTWDWLWSLFRGKPRPTPQSETPVASELMLSLHFNLADFLHSDTAIRLGIPVVADKDGPIFAALEAWCANIGEPLYARYGDTIHINSGYRPPELNKAIGGATDSQHCKGEAVDFTVRGVPVHEVSLWLANSALPFDQLIWEFDAWTHCSYTTAQTARHSVLTASKVNGKTVYTQGIAV